MRFRLVSRNMGVCLQFRTISDVCYSTFACSEVLSCGETCKICQVWVRAVLSTSENVGMWKGQHLCLPIDIIEIDGQAWSLALDIDTHNDF